MRLDIQKPLMRGVTVCVEKEMGEEVPLWCPVKYEFLLDFCYTCGLIGHMDRMCSTKLEKGATQQFNKDLHFIPEKKRMEDYVGERDMSSRQLWWGGGAEVEEAGALQEEGVSMDQEAMRHHGGKLRRKRRRRRK